MKITTPLNATITTAATAAGFNNTNNHNNTNELGLKAANEPVNRLENQLNAEEALTQRISLEGGRGSKELLRFCRELAIILLRSYRSDEEVGELRDKLSASLMVTLNCTEKQALCLVELALELIHAKLRGSYKRTEVELSYLIATATGAVSDVSAN